jgi:hypothetical protein
MYGMICDMCSPLSAPTFEAPGRMAHGRQLRLMIAYTFISLCFMTISFAQFALKNAENVRLVYVDTICCCKNLTGMGNILGTKSKDVDVVDHHGVDVVHLKHKCTILEYHVIYHNCTPIQLEIKYICRKCTYITDICRKYILLYE